MSNSRSLAKLPAFLSPAGVLSPLAGGTGVTSLNATVNALNLTIGEDVQAWHSTLDAIVAIPGTTGLLKKTGTSTWTLDTNAYLTGITGNQVTGALGFTPYNSTNPSGYISGITSSNVTTALGFTPYNSTNPNGYISGITSSNVTTALGYTPENSAVKGSANGYASLDGSGLVPSSQLPSYVDDVLEYANLAGFPATGTTGKIYVALDTNKTYRWSGSAYIYITSGAVDSVAGKTGVVSLTSSDVGLGNVENKSSATIRSEISSANVTSALGFTPYNATNPSGYITGITSGNVTTALGFTPYNSTNPAGYITGITSSNVTSALGFTPYNATNPAGYITGYTETDTLATVTARGGTTSGGITINSGTNDQGLTMTVSDGGWNYIGFSHGATRKAYFGLDGSGNPQWGSDSGAFTITGNYTTIGTSTRSPIFYDSDNTGYYVDPASQSLLNTLKVSGGDSVTPTQQIEASVYPMLDFISTSADTNNRNWRIAGVYNSYGLLQILSGTSVNATPTTARLGISGSSGYVGIGAAATGPVNHFQIGSMGSTGFSGNHIAIGNGTQVFAQYVNGATSVDFYTNSGYFNFDKYIQATGSMRSPIFYDSGDTSYYIDPTSNSVLSTATFNVNGSSSITLAPAGTDASMIKAGSGDELYIGGNNTWQMRFSGANVLMDNGGYLLNAESIRSAIFYDSNNTGYYIDPASTSRLVSTIIGGHGGNAYDTVTSGRLYLGTNADNSYSIYTHLESVNGNYTKLTLDWHTGIKIGAAKLYGGTRFYNNSINSGGAQIFSVGDGDDNVRALYGFYTPITYDSNNTGYYINPNGSSVLDSVTVNSIYGPINGMGSGGDAISGMGTATTWDARPGGIYDRYAINYHTGISLSGYPSYGGVRLYSAAYPSLSNSTLRLEASTGVYTYGQFTNDNRIDAPIYYDYNDSSYYIDPNGQSRTNYISVNVGNENYGAANSSTAGLLMRGNYNSNTWAHKFHKYDAGGGVPLILSETVGAAAWNRVQSWGTSTGYSYTSQVYGSFNADSLYSTIYYDSNNTAYYTNPASTSVLNALTVADVTAGSLISTSYVQLNGPIYRASGGTGYLNGQYASSENGGTSGPIYSIGGSYLPGTTSLGNMYGVGYAVGNISGIGIVANWGFYVASAGVARIFLDSDAGVGYASGSFRAPLFYDRDNTGYWVDPGNSTTSAVFAGPIVSAGGLQGATSGYTTPYSIFTLSNTYSSGSSFYGIRYVEGNPDVIQFIGGGSVGLSVGMDIGDTTASSSLRAPIFYDSNNTGYYVDAAGTTVLNALTVGGQPVTGGGGDSGPIFSAF